MTPQSLLTFLDRFFLFFYSNVFLVTKVLTPFDFESLEENKKTYINCVRQNTVQIFNFSIETPKSLKLYRFERFTFNGRIKNSYYINLLNIFFIILSCTRSNFYSITHGHVVMKSHLFFYQYFRHGMSFRRKL